MLLTQWSTVGGACDGNYYYEKIDWVVTLGIVIFIVNCAASCQGNRGQYEKAGSSDNPERERARESEGIEIEVGAHHDHDMILP